MKVAILGAGSWGTALALVLMNNGHEVMLWSKFQSELDEISEAKENRSKLPGIVLPDSLLYNSNIEKACQWATILVMAVPSKFVRSTARLAAPYITREHIIVNVAKGIEDESRMTLDRV
ncbi:MAG: NAD(P)-binding domain-containing protein, partial [Vallitaleaceae bacterium]|nr:NAD(P)-binding domain-containing protein [Vallitaleaceae bacterium]